MKQWICLHNHNMLWSCEHVLSWTFKDTSLDLLQTASVTTSYFLRSWWTPSSCLQFYTLGTHDVILSIINVNLKKTKKKNDIQYHLITTAILTPVSGTVCKHKVIALIRQLVPHSILLLGIYRRVQITLGTRTVPGWGFFNCGEYVVAKSPVVSCWFDRESFTAPVAEGCRTPR